MKHQNDYLRKEYALCLKDLPQYRGGVLCFKKGKIYKIMYSNPNMESLRLINEQGNFHDVTSDASDGTGWFQHFDIKKRVLFEKKK